MVESFLLQSGRRCLCEVLSDGGGEGAGGIKSLSAVFNTEVSVALQGHGWTCFLLLFCQNSSKAQINLSHLMKALRKILTYNQKRFSFICEDRYSGRSFWVFFNVFFNCLPVFLFKEIMH